MAMKRFLAIGSQLVIVTALVTACGGGNGSTANNTSNGGSTSAKPSDGTLTVALDGNPTTTDPYDTQDNLSYTIEKTMYQGLLGFDKDMKMIPVLAQSYEVNKAATQITFKLRQGIKFSDGTPFNADAVKVNLDRARDKNNHLKRYSLFSMIKDVKVIDPYTVQVDLSSPFGAIAANFAHPAAMMISPKALQEYGTKIAQHPVGTGPYEFVSWKDGSDLLVKQNPDYAGTHTNVKQIDFKFVKDAGTRAAMLETGEAQFEYPVPTDQVTTIKSKPNVVVETKNSNIVDYLALNTTVKPFDDVRVRQALNYAIDKDAFVKVAQNGFGSPAKSSIAPSTWGYVAQSGYDYNLDKAKQLLKDAGYPNGFDTTLISNNSSERVKWDQFIQQQLSQIGVKVDIQAVDSATLDSEVFVPQDKSKMKMYIGGWSPSTGDADWGLRPLLTKANFPPTGYNIGFYTDPVVEKAIQGGLDTADPTQRQQDYSVAQKQIWDDAPWVFLSNPQLVFAHSSNLTGATMLPDSTMYLNDASFTN